ncbi:vitamin D3 receptor-like isoform X2 [Watersipora subatra]|uniref:vitamin D3 receptor-like isoform X2 n=1 Tax=Watersipora subatra TaxID=2589382 RepID=UPI00355BBB5E
MDLNSAGLHALWESVFMKMEQEPSPTGGQVMLGNVNDPMRQRGRVKEDKYCGVCGDRALGYNFDAISCESCKAFFRRNAPKGLEYFKCPYDEHCKMDVSNRRFCKRCRLKKCFDIGMRKEYILTEEEKSKKRQKIEENRKMKDSDKSMDSDDVNSNCSMDIGQSDRVVPLTEQDQLEIDDIVTSYTTSLEIIANNGGQKDSIKDLVNVCEVSIRRVIDMAKKMKSFKALPQSAQICLLKGGSIELLIIRSVLTFDRERQRFLEQTDNPQTSAITIDQFKSAALNADTSDLSNMSSGRTIDPKQQFSLVEDIMKFVKVLSLELKADETMLIFLLLVSLFSPDRPNLDQKDLKDAVSKEQERYSALLRRYLESKMPRRKAAIYYAKLLMKLTDIRNLNEESSQVFLSMNAETIQPLMIEVLDIPGAKALASDVPGQQTPAVVTAQS